MNKLVDGKREGTWVEIDEFGRTINSFYKNGLLEGKRECISNRLRKVFTETYSNGLRNGLSIIYFDDGETISDEKYYKDDLLHGKYTAYNDDGTLYTICYYENNLLNGTYKEYYDVSGQVALEYNYKDGVIDGLRATYHYNGKIETIVEYINGQRQGEEFSYDEIGSITRKSYYVDGVRNGELIEYYSKGEGGGILSKCNCVNGLIEGIYETYHPDGSICMRVNYINNNRQGECINYFDNSLGNGISSIAIYINNKKEGIFQTYLPNGTLRGIVNFKSNYKNGESYEYYSNGNLKSIRFFNGERGRFSYLPTWISEYSNTGIINRKSKGKKVKEIETSVKDVWDIF